MIPTVIAALAALVVRSLAAARLQRWYLGTPVVMVLAGIASALVDGGRFVDATLGTVVAQQVAEIVLAVLLFGDAAGMRAGRLGGREPGAVARLLLVALPLSLAAATALGALLLPGLPWAVLLVAACVVVPVDLAPTEGLSRDRRLPSRVRSVLTVEGGYTDGIVSPVFLFALVLASDRTAERTAGEALATVVPFALTALAVGLVLGGVLGVVLDRVTAAGWTTGSSRRVVVLASPLLAYFGTVALGGNGFVASFVAGVAFRTVHRYAWARRRRAAPAGSAGAAGSPAPDPAQDYRLLEDTSALLTAVMWFAVGAAGVLAVTTGVPPAVLLYCLAALTVVRGVPVLLALTRSSLVIRDRILVAALGPRGTTTVVFGLLAYNGLPAGAEADTVLLATVVCVVSSVALQGATAALAARGLAPDEHHGATGTAPARPVLRREDD